MRRALPEGSPPPLLVSGETGDGLPRLWSTIIRAIDEAPGPAGPNGPASAV
jgi:hypothetical protein